METPSPYLPMFETFKAALDTHHDRRERAIKASRDITAASKKIIFALHRTRTPGPLHASITKATAPHWTIIRTAYASISPDLQGLNAYRYAGQLTGGNQEFIEALGFETYLSTGTLLGYESARERVAGLGKGEGGDGGKGAESVSVSEKKTEEASAPAENEKHPAEQQKEPNPINLTPEDYILGIFDLTGELMRYAITSMATTGRLPSTSIPSSIADPHAMDTDSAPPSPSRTPHTDLHTIRTFLTCLIIPGGSRFASDVEKKTPVMLECVDKVEKALYGLVIRGRERPVGWIAELGAGVGAGVQGERERGREGLADR